MKILIVLPRFPYPLEKGDKLRAYHQIVELAQAHDLYLFCVNHGKVAPEWEEALRPYCKDIKVVRPNRLVCYANVIRHWFVAKSLQMGYWVTNRVKRLYRQYEQQVQPDVVYSQMLRTMPIVARSKYPKVMDFQDALSMNTERRMERSRGLWRFVLHQEFKMLRSSEYNAFSIFDALTIISEADSEAIPHKKNGEIKVVPNGVDMHYFSPSYKQRMGEYDLLFCGNMSYAPNVDAAHFLVEQVMPLVWEKRPQTTLLFAGSNPKHSVCALGKDERVHVSGWIDDMRKAYASCRLFVAPMQMGSGLQNKLLEAMAMQMPCITTSIAQSPLGAVNGRDIMVADSATSIAEAILLLLGDEPRARALAEAGCNYVAQHFQWSTSVATLERLLSEIAAQR